MSIIDLIISLKKEGIHIKVENENIILSGNVDKISSEELQNLKEKKQEIICFLNEKKMNYVNLSKFDKIKYYPLSYAQKSLYFIHKMQPDSIAYNLPQVLYFPKEFDKDKFVKVVEMLIERHSILRVGFYEDNGTPLQYVRDEIAIEFLNITDFSLSDDKLIRSFIKPFDLEQEPLVRFGIAQTIDLNWLVIIDMHHIITDGLSNLILKNELEQLYHGNTLPTITIDYFDYCLWQNSEDQKNELEKSKGFWLGNFGQKLPLLELPLDYNRVETKNKKTKNISFNLSIEQTELIHNFSKTNLMTTQMAVLGFLGILISRLTSQEDIVIGNVVNGRAHLDLENSIGNFVNVIPMKIGVRKTMTVQEYFSSIKEFSIKALENQAYPLERLIDDLSPDRQKGRQPLFDVLFNFMNYDEQDNVLSEEKENTSSSLITSKGFDLVFNVNSYKNRLHFNFQYCDLLFSDQTMRGFVKGFKTLIAECTLLDKKNVSEVDIIDDHEKKILIDSLKGFSVSDSDISTVHSLFEMHAKINPGHIAVKFGTQEITYVDLNKKANYISSLLREKYTGERESIGIIADNPIEIIASILAVLKSGNSYCLISTQDPIKRKREIILNCGLKAVILDKKYAEFGDITDQIEISFDNKDLRLELYEENSDLHLLSSSSAIITYNSGPEGIFGSKISHGSILNSMLNNFSKFNFSSADKWMIFKTLSFTNGSFEMFGALLFGGQLLISTLQESENIDALHKFAFHNEVTIINLTPSEFQKFRNADRKSNITLSIRNLFLGGEVLNFADLWDWKRKYFEGNIINLYGLSEAGIVSSYKEITYNDISNGKSNIGAPISNTSFYILDQDCKLVPKGCKGEICISGEYIDNSVPNKKNAINPFDSSKFLLKTGDYGRLLPNNEIEFLGRKDGQIKRHGHRVELHEIKKSILLHNDVQDAEIVYTKVNGEMKIAVYFVGKADPSVLISFLSDILPRYMVPDFFKEITSIPRNIDGETDLSVLSTSNFEEELIYVNSVSETQAKLIDIWSAILPQNIKFGTRDNFFDLGGHSLKILNMVASIKEKFGVYIPIMFIYTNPYIKDIAEAIDQNSYANNETIFFNSKDKRMIFCLPPGLSYGVCYKVIAEQIEDYCFCAFNYLKDDNFVVKVVDQIIELQPESPYILMGYSGGGKSLYPVVKELEKRGKSISHLISIDGYWETNKNEYDVLEIYQEFLDQLDSSYFDYLSIELKSRIRSYDSFLRNIQFDTKLNSKMHFLVSQGGKIIETEHHINKEIEKIKEMINQYSTEETQVYKAMGIHGDLLDEKYIKNTSQIISNILLK